MVRQGFCAVYLATGGTVAILKTDSLHLPLSTGVVTESDRSSHSSETILQENHPSIIMRKCEVVQLTVQHMYFNCIVGYILQLSIYLYYKAKVL